MQCIFWSIEILPSNANPFLPFCLVFLIFLAFFIYHDRLWRIGCSNMSFSWLIPFRAANHPLPFRFIFCLFLTKDDFLNMYLCLDILSKVCQLKWFQIVQKLMKSSTELSNRWVIQSKKRKNAVVPKFHTVLSKCLKCI